MTDTKKLFKLLEELTIAANEARLAGKTIEKIIIDKEFETLLLEMIEMFPAGDSPYRTERTLLGFPCEVEDKIQFKLKLL